MLDTADNYCLDLFPEMRTAYGREKLEEVSEFGTYIFHEDYFVPFVTSSGGDSVFLKRVANYVEYLASNQNHHLQNLASIGLLAAFVDRRFVELAPYLGICSQRLMQVNNFTVKFDPKTWLK